jgi:hypothetical protein
MATDMLSNGGRSLLSPPASPAHAKKSTTLDVYGHVIAGGDRDAAEARAGSLAPPPPAPIAHPLSALNPIVPSFVARTWGALSEHHRSSDTSLAPGLERFGPGIKELERTDAKATDSLAVSGLSASASLQRAAPMRSTRTVFVVPAWSIGVPARMTT